MSGKIEPGVNALPWREKRLAERSSRSAILWSGGSVLLHHFNQKNLGSFWSIRHRWDEQWKIGNSWQCSQPAYDAEFIDAFSWWLSEKAEWFLEHRARGPMAIDAWAAALWSDSRIQAAWPVVAEAIHRLESWRGEQKASPAAEPLLLNDGTGAFARFFKALVKDQAVPENISFAVPWEELEKKMKIPAYVKRIRGKLNVPRERFWLTAQGLYRQAQPFGVTASKSRRVSR
ncbi:MAG: hypothetical protein HZA50_10275 [Planctomycetes bacterium]|nr:hypothetical protein [Planctomycetota bacterium]